MLPGNDEDMDIMKASKIIRDHNDKPTYDEILYQSNIEML